MASTVQNGCHHMANLLSELGYNPPRRRACSSQKDPFWLPSATAESSSGEILPLLDLCSQSCSCGRLGRLAAPAPGCLVSSEAGELVALALTSSLPAGAFKSEGKEKLPPPDDFLSWYRSCGFPARLPTAVSAIKRGLVTHQLVKRLAECAARFAEPSVQTALLFLLALLKKKL